MLNKEHQDKDSYGTRFLPVGVPTEHEWLILKELPNGSMLMYCKWCLHTEQLDLPIPDQNISDPTKMYGPS